jgi:MoaA/NifB/PqqE/SkfB family radical SAM enzyme
MPLDLPQMVCFRVTRQCNARCRFCLAPPDDVHPDIETLRHCLDWLLSHGVKTIHFCGGEPTIHPALSQLLLHVNEQGGKTKLTTNAISISDTLLSTLRVVDTEVKVSLHGNLEHHNNMVGVKSFKHTTRNLRRLVAAGVRTTVQTTVVAGQTWVVDWVANFCLELGIRRLSILPFIPRGNGDNCRDEFDLLSSQRDNLRDLVKKKRRSLSGRLDIRWLDFAAKSLTVVEPDGRVVLEGLTEATDKVLCHIGS